MKLYRNEFYLIFYEQFGDILDMKLILKTIDSRSYR